MDSAPKDTAESAPQSAPTASDWNDEFVGVGGQYVVDPVTGRRRPVEPPPEPTAEGGAAASGAKVFKGKKGL